MIKKIVIALSGLWFCAAACFADPLPSWTNGKLKDTIISFVHDTTAEGSDKYVLPSGRIAVFDNDGTLWAEQPMYVQLAFAIDRIKELAKTHPEWKDREPFKSVLAGDLSHMSEQDVMAIVAATHAGMSSDEFSDIVLNWLATARHPKTGQRYDAMVYQPMLELVFYLQQNGYKVFIVSGGGIDFMRPWTERVYGIPPEQVVGSSVKMKFEMKAGKPVIMRLPEVGFIDDKAGKPVGIQNHIGRRPVIAVGNSDGDLEMLQWTTSATESPSVPRLGLIVHHTDEAREYAYDRNSPFGRLSKALDMAASENWHLIDMKKDWLTVFSFEGKK